VGQEEGLGVGEGTGTRCANVSESASSSGKCAQSFVRVGGDLLKRPRARAGFELCRLGRYQDV
jgi:hypothetical protein